MVKDTIYREKAIPEIQERFRELLKEPHVERTAVINYLSRRSVKGLFPMTFATDTGAWVVYGSGFEYLRKKVGDYSAMKKPVAYIIPMLMDGKYLDPPTVDTIQVDDIMHSGYAYPNVESYRHQLWAFRKAIEEINEKYKQHRKIKSPVDDRLQGYGVVGVNIPYDEPEWVTAIQKGKPAHNPARDDKGVWYFAEQAIPIEKVRKGIRKLIKHDPDTWKALAGAIFIRDVTLGIPKHKVPDLRDVQQSFVRSMKKFLKNAKQTVCEAGWDGHARLLVKSTPINPSTVWVVDPWMSPERIIASPTYPRLRDVFKEHLNVTLEPAIKPADQGDEGSCVIAAFARALWIAREGIAVATQHPIPDDYAVVALRLLKPRKAVMPVIVVQKQENKVRSIPSHNPIVMRKRVGKPASEPRRRYVEDMVADLPCMSYSNRELLSHQKRIIQFMMSTQQKGIILFHSLGSGKTITGIALSRCLMYGKPGLKFVVATPASVQKQFEKEIKGMGAADLDGRYTVVTHHGLARHEDDLVDSRTILIIDEAHNFKNPNGVLTQGALHAASKAYKIILLTATPVINKTTDMAVMLAMVNGIEQPTEFMKQLSEPTVDPSLIKCKFSYYHTPFDVRNFPIVTERYQTFRMTPEYYKDYLVIQRNEIEDTSGDFRDFTGTHLETFMNGIRRAANLIGDKPSPKMDWTVEKTLDEVSKGRKVVIFSGFRTNGTRAIQARLSEKGVSSVLIDGSITPKKRAEAVEKYNSGAVQVLEITMAGAEGLDLKGTRTLIVVDPWWNLGKMNQIVGRVARYRSHTALPKEDRNVDVYYLVLKKPKERAVGDTMLSCDELLYRMAEYKNESVVNLYDTIKDHAAETCIKEKRNEA